MSSPIIVGLALREDDAAPLALAQTLSGIDASPLVLAHAIRPDLPGPIPIAEYQEIVHRERSQKLAEVASRLPRDLQVSTRVTDGSPSHVIQSLVTEFGAVAAVVGSTTRGAMGRVLAGDTAAGLLHDTACPVAVAPRGYRAGAIATIGVAYDASPESENALTAAVGISLETGAAIRVLTVLEPLASHAGLRATAARGGAGDHRPGAGLDPPRGARDGRGDRGRGRRGARDQLVGSSTCSCAAPAATGRCMPSRAAASPAGCPTGARARS